MSENNSSCYRVFRHAVMLGITAIAWTPVGALAQPAASPELGGAETFAVLARAAVAASSASTVSGDVGAAAGGTVTGFPPATLAPGSTIHAGDAVASQAHHSARAAYTDLAGRTCLVANNLTGQDLGGQSLAGGVYCFDGDAPLTGTLTLTGAGPWIFQVAGGLTVSAGATVATPDVTTVCKGTSVYWQVGDDLLATPLVQTTIGAGATFVGNVLARGNIELLGNAAVDGRVISLGEMAGGALGGGTVTMEANAVSACSYGRLLPTHAPFKVTGGGQVFVPDPDSSDPDATGTGRANYGFNAQPGAAGAPATGRFNYINHVIAPHIHANGPVTDVDVIALNDDGTPRTARFSGTCDQLLPSCTFSVMVEDNGEPGRDDQFGVTIVANGAIVEARSMRQVRNGNIQFHTATLTTTVNAPTRRAGQTLRLSASLRRDRTGTPADAYVVLRLPGGQMLSWTGSALVPGLVPLARNFVPIDFDGEILQVTVPAGAPLGAYTWMSVLTEAGTLNLLSGISEQSVIITP